jgi:hypothetical protein
MKALIQKLQQDAGLTEEQATKSVQVVKEFIQSKLPPMMHGLVDNFMDSNNDADEEDYVDGTSGTQQTNWSDKAKKVTDDATEKLEGFKSEAEEFAKEASSKFSQWATKAEAAADEAINTLKDMIKPKDEKFKGEDEDAKQPPKEKL